MHRNRILSSNLSEFSDNPELSQSVESPTSVSRRRLQSDEFSGDEENPNSRQKNEMIDNAVLVEPIGMVDLQATSSRNLADDLERNSLVGQEVNPTDVQNSQVEDARSLSGREALQALEFSFLDNKNVCCGLCGEIVPYEQLVSDHLPKSHADAFGSSDGPSKTADSSRARPIETLKERLSREKRSIETAFKLSAYRSATRIPRTLPTKRRRLGDEPLRKVSTIRVNPRTMSLAELEQALKKKIFEKLNRRVPVTLMDKLHARCGMCNSIISLNKKFEIVHLIRHFNCWHPTVHPCAGSWQDRQSKRRGVKPLSINDFAVVDTGSGSPDSLQCIWCGMFVEAQCLAQHFGEVHPDDVEVPKCNLCMQELIFTARLQEKFNLEVKITLPDEHHMKCSLCSTIFSSEVNLESHIQRRHISGIAAIDDTQPDEEDVNLEEIGPEAFANSRMTLGKRRRPKRQFIMPALRQAAPLDSTFVEPIAECHWKCKLCSADIYGAVISAAAIRHYKYHHVDHADNMQYDICKSRLEKISDSCMEFIHPQLIECLLCQQSFNLHQPFNMCRAIRHLKAKHPNLMPEYAGLSQFDSMEEDDDGLDVAPTYGHPQKPVRLVFADHPLGYAQQPILHPDLGEASSSGIIVYNMAQVIAGGVDDAQDVAGADAADTVAFDIEASPAIPQHYSAAFPLSTPRPFMDVRDLGAPIGGSPGIRAFRTPTLVRRQNQGASSVAAKNARLDHGSIARPFPEQHRLAVLDRRMLGAPRTLVLQNRPQIQPRQFYLVFPSNESSQVPQNVLAPNLIDGPFSRDNSTDNRQLITSMDDSIMDGSRLPDFMSQSHDVLPARVGHRQQELWQETIH